MFGFSLFNQEKENIQEGVNDPAIFKAIFTAGGPGSGKTYVTNKLGLKALGYKSINIDNAFELVAKKQNFSLKMSDKDMKRIEALRARARNLTDKQMTLALQGRLGLVIDGTGKDFKKIERTKKRLEQFGYDTMMVLTNTSQEVALERNRKRRRSVPEEFLKDSWQQVQDNIGKFQSLFGNDRFIVVDNSEGEPDVSKAYRTVLKFTRSPPRSDIARKWIRENS